MSCNVGYTIRRQIEKTDENTERLVREMRAMRDEMERMRRDNVKILDAFNRLSASIDDLARTVRKMHEDVYPSVEETKPDLKKRQGPSQG